MRHDARYGTAIGLLDLIFSGEPAEKVLTNWARANRYAGSGDRAAVRDIVFGALRGKKYYQTLAGATDGRGTILGQVIAAGQDAGMIFTGQVHAPDPLSPSESGLLARGPVPPGPVYDIPDWLEDELRQSLGADFEGTMAELRLRAPVDLRINFLKTDRSGAIAQLAGEGVRTAPLQVADGGLRVTDGERKVAQSSAYKDGLIELQDAGSQAVVDALPLRDGATVLDYCAGGGGKSLAIASRTRGKARILAYDVSVNRLKNLVDRADRAGADISVSDADPALRGATYDLVLLDVPCSGSGAWRRNPDSKWKFTPEDLTALTRTQDKILDVAAGLVGTGGVLAYVTCSLLRAENEDRIIGFLDRNAGWTAQLQRRFPLGRGGDGFFLCLLART